MHKKVAKARLIRWILFLQEFDLKIKDKTGVENVISDHLLCIPNTPSNELPINEDFLMNNSKLLLGNHGLPT